MNPRRFSVALSFPGEHREFVSRVASNLADQLSKPRILYDKYHEAEFARPNLDLHLPNLYRTESDLIVIFLCAEYANKRWCNLEWRFIRQLISTADEDRIMFLSFDEVGAIPEIGILSGDGYAVIGTRSPEEIADLILQRLGSLPNEQGRYFELAHLGATRRVDHVDFPTSNAEELTGKARKPQEMMSGSATSRHNWINVLPPAKTLGLFCVILAAFAISLWLAAPLLTKLGLLVDASPFARTAAATIPFGCAVFLFNHWLVRKLEAAGRERQRAALEELTHRILERLREPRLLTAPAVRGLACGIEQRSHCPVITDKLIIEAIRGAALKVEEELNDDSVVQRLKRLNKLLKEIDADAIPLLSLDYVDRLSACVRSQPILMGVLLIGLLALGLGVNVLGWKAFPLIAAVCCVFLLLLQCLLLLSTLRAVRAWAPPGKGIQIGGFLDALLIVCTSRNPWVARFLHMIWGPFWEFLPMHVMGPGRFAVMHEFRFDFARDLWAQLRIVQLKLDGVRPTTPTERIDLDREFKRLCRELWVVTGDDSFRQMERRGEISREDIANCVVKHF